VSAKVVEAAHAVPLDKESWQNLRVKVGLEPIPPNASSNPWAIDEVRKITKKCGFEKLIGYKEFVKAQKDNAKKKAEEKKAQKKE